MCVGGIIDCMFHIKPSQHSSHHVSITSPEEIKYNGLSIPGLFDGQLSRETCVYSFVRPNPSALVT